ncbi:hypothetical protein Pcinc_008847 [Petrolisthes cinctipes]|uniref:tRNA pseudouridine synthase n=1 Tax=Petrolisthes cinctipes TaxID=88211 RepID=A0AAE1G6I1_PETCI|nr:hypothetical protein Pcinc_008847 [Petrolisthes cinctipes]
MCVATIEGEAFPVHQIRCIMAVLLMVGEGKESPHVVAQLLNVNKHPRKPQYTMASEVPLNLYGSCFDGVSWRWDDLELYLNISHFQHLWTQQAIRASMISRMLWDLEHRYQHSHPHTTTTPTPVTNITRRQQVIGTRETTNEVEIGKEEGQAVKEKDEDGDQLREAKRGKVNREKTVDDNGDQQKETKRGKVNREKTVDDDRDQQGKGNREKTVDDNGDQQKETKQENVNTERDQQKETKQENVNTERDQQKETKQGKLNREKTVDGCQKVTQATTPPPPPPLPLPQHQIECLFLGAKRKVHQPLLSRLTCESLETRVQHYVKRQRLGPEVLLKLTSGTTTTTSSNKEGND